MGFSNPHFLHVLCKVFLLLSGGDSQLPGRMVCIPDDH